jgi:hypothetical protein
MLESTHYYGDLILLLLNAKTSTFLSNVDLEVKMF